MASAAPQGLPLLYRDLAPLSSQAHAGWQLRPAGTVALIAGVHALPITVDEFTAAQRSLPIVFASGPDPVPLALMGLNEGVNVFVDEEGRFNPAAYLPAYARRYPFMLARLQPDSEELTLCFDPTSDLIGPGDADGEGAGELALFDGDQPTERVNEALKFCQDFEMAAQRTQAFTRELGELGLLEEGEVTIQNPQFPQPFVYRGFQMVNEQKLRDLRGDQLRKMSQSGMLPLLHAHLFSLGLMTEIFARQMELGKLPPQGMLAPA